VQSWNNFLWPLIISSDDEHKVATVALATLQQGIGGDFNLMMAGSFVTLVPMVVIFLCFQRFIVRSVVLTGLK
jgi:multiple sugar transport system permease protein